MTIYTHKSSGLSKPCPTEFRDKTKNFNHKFLIIFAIRTTTRTNKLAGQNLTQKLLQTSSTSEPTNSQNSFAFSKTHSQKPWVFQTLSPWISCQTPKPSQMQSNVTQSWWIELFDYASWFSVDWGSPKLIINPPRFSLQRDCKATDHTSNQGLDHLHAPHVTTPAQLWGRQKSLETPLKYSDAIETLKLC